MAQISVRSTFYNEDRTKQPYSTIAELKKDHGCKFSLLQIFHCCKWSPKEAHCLSDGSKHKL